MDSFDPGLFVHVHDHDHDHDHVVGKPEQTRRFVRF